MSPPQLSVDLPIPSRLTNDSLPHTLRVFHSVVSLARHPFPPPNSISPHLKSPGNCIHPGYRVIVPIITATRARVINATGYPTHAPAPYERDTAEDSPLNGCSAGPPFFPSPNGLPFSSFLPSYILFRARCCSCNFPLSEETEVIDRGMHFVSYVIDGVICEAWNENRRWICERGILLFSWLSIYLKRSFRTIFFWIIETL